MLKSKALEHNCMVSLTYHSLYTDWDASLVSPATELCRCPVTILSGAFDFNDENGVLVTLKFAREQFHTDNPIGKELIWYVSGEEYQKLIVKGIVKDWPTNTNLPYQVIRPIENENRERWEVPSMTYILIKKGTDNQRFKKKLEALKLKEILDEPSYTIVPLTEAYHTEPTYNNASLKFEQVVLFALLGILVIACALFNYLNLYASRIRIRIKELSLRKVNGASNRELFILLATEFILLIGMACMLGLFGIELCLPAFKRFAGIESEYIHIYIELGAYILVLIGISLTLAFLVINITRRRLFQESVRIVMSPHKKSLFSKMSLLLQMVISLGCIFCTTIYYKQIYTLDNKNPGFNRANRLSVNIVPKSTYFFTTSYFNTQDEMNTFIHGFKEIPTIENVTPLSQGMILPQFISSRALAHTEEMSENECVEYEVFKASPDYIQFYGLQLIAGSTFKPVSADNRTDVIINEAMVKALGLKEPVGKTIIHSSKSYYSEGKEQNNGVKYPCLIIGVVKDFIYDSSIVQVSPVAISCWESLSSSLGIKYQPDTYPETKKAIEEYVKKNFPDRQANVYNMDDEYKKQYASEASLRMSLTLLTLVCIIISLFGIYSVVVLDCEYRRKEIAVRKVNGAPLFAIFYLFFKEYVLLLGVAALIAFPPGYLIMKPWTEKYIMQTEISWWVYPLLFLLTFVVVLISITGRIWHTAHINPSSELKKD